MIDLLMGFMYGWGFILTIIGAIFLMLSIFAQVDNIDPPKWYHWVVSLLIIHVGITFVYFGGMYFE